MAKFIPCTDMDGKPVWINFDKVLKLRRVQSRSGQPDVTHVVMEGETISVREEPQELGNAANK